MSNIQYKSPSPVGAYSQIAITTAQRLGFIAGQLSVDSKGAIVGENDFEVQFRTVMSNLESVIFENGGSWDSVLKFTTYLVDSRAIAAFYEVRAKLFPEYFGNGLYPPNTLLVVDRLVREPFLIEIEATVSFPA